MIKEGNAERQESARRQADRFKRRVRFTYCSKDEVTEINLMLDEEVNENEGKKISTMYMWKMLTGARPNNHRSGLFFKKNPTFVIIISLNRRALQDCALMCMFAVWKRQSREQTRRKAEVYFIPEHFITFCCLLIQASLESANSTGQMEMKAERLNRLRLPSTRRVQSCTRAATAGRWEALVAGGVLGRFVWRDCVVGQLVQETFFFVSRWLCGQRWTVNEGRRTVINKYKKASG